MDILIGITLAIVALAALLVALVWMDDHVTNVRKAGPAARATFALLWLVLTLFFALDLGHSAGERFGWWDERERVKCTTTEVYDADGVKTSSYASCSKTATR